MRPKTNFITHHRKVRRKVPSSTATKTNYHDRAKSPSAVCVVIYREVLGSLLHPGSLASERPFRVYVCRGGSREGGSDQRVLLSTTHRDGLDYVRGSLRRRWHYSYHSSCRTHEVSDQGPGYTRCQERGVGSRSSLAPCPP